MMANLLRNDWHILARPVTFYIILLDCFLFELIFWTESMSITVASLVFVLQFVMLIASCEEKDNSQIFVGSLPTSRSQVIMAKYVDGFLFTIVGIALAVILAWLNRLFRVGLDLSVSSFDLMGTLGAALLMLAVFYPVFYKFDRWSLAFTAAIVLELAYILVIPNDWSGSGYGWILAGCILVYVGSYLLSLRFYLKKDL